MNLSESELHSLIAKLDKRINTLFTGILFLLSIEVVLCVLQFISSIAVE